MLSVQIRRMEFWKPLFVSPLFVANLPAAMAGSLADFAARPLRKYFNGHNASHNPHWAQSVWPDRKIYSLGSGIFRGPQPAEDDIRYLADFGIKTVVTLRRYHKEAHLVEKYGMDSVRIGVNTLTPYEYQIVSFLKMATDESCKPLFVHCLHGADRTGMMCAAYRVVVDNWTIQQAMDEWLRGPYGFHRVFNHLKRFFRSLDFEAIRREVFACPDRQVAFESDKTNTQYI